MIFSGIRIKIVFDFFYIDGPLSLGKLSVLQTAKGKKIKIIGDLLEFDARGNKLDLIKATHPADPLACCRDMFHHWLDGHGVRPCSWRKLIELLEDCDLAELAKQVHSAI